jgi:pantothenate kinase type III
VDRILIADGTATGVRTRQNGQTADHFAAAEVIVATGGLATLFEEESEHIDEVDSELTLKGLKIIYDRNRAPSRIASRRARQ